MESICSQDNGEPLLDIELGDEMEDENQQNVVDVEDVADAEPSLESPIADFVVYNNIQRHLKAQATSPGDTGSATGPPPNGGLPRTLLFKEVNYETLKAVPADFLETELMASHIPAIARKLIYEVLKLLCGLPALKSFSNHLCLKGWATKNWTVSSRTFIPVQLWESMRQYWMERHLYMTSYSNMLTLHLQN
jgi:hypothetical protein